MTPFENLKVGMNVIDTNGVKSVIKEIDDIHNIVVTNDAGFFGIYCQDETCESFDPLTEFKLY